MSDAVIPGTLAPEPDRVQGRSLMSLTLASLRAAAFDLDDTLCGRTAAAARLYRRWLGALADRDFVEVMARDDRGHSPRGPFFAWLTGAFPQAGSSGTDAWNRFRQELPGELRPCEGAARLLTRLRGHGLPLAILTNGGRGFQLAKLEAAGLADFFDPSLIFAADDLPRPKPYAEAFATVVRALGMPADRVLFVGDDPELDIRGARDAGLRCCRVRNEYTAPKAEPDTVEADLTVNDPAELEAFLFPIK